MACRTPRASASASSELAEPSYPATIVQPKSRLPHLIGELGRGALPSRFPIPLHTNRPADSPVAPSGPLAPPGWPIISRQDRAKRPQLSRHNDLPPGIHPNAPIRLAPEQPRRSGRSGSGWQAAGGMALLVPCPAAAPDFTLRGSSAAELPDCAAGPRDPVLGQELRRGLFHRHHDSFCVLKPVRRCMRTAALQGRPETGRRPGMAGSGRSSR